MMRSLLWAGMAIFAAVGAGMDEPHPVLAELFTSEGCSSCPPADALLERLDRSQTVAGAQIIVMSEHVDYWNRLGWADPYSSPAFSARQTAYARRFRIDGPYTPQMVIDGHTQFVGSDAREADAAIRAAARQHKVAVRISGGGKSVMVDVEPLAHRADVFVAYAADAGTQDVLRGENKGRRLQHVSVVKSLKQVGSLDERTGFHGEVPVENGMRLIVFVQEPGNGTVWGAAMRPSAQ